MGYGYVNGEREPARESWKVNIGWTGFLARNQSALFDDRIQRGFGRDICQNVPDNIVAPVQMRAVATSESMIAMSSNYHLVALWA